MKMKLNAAELEESDLPQNLGTLHKFINNVAHSFIINELVSLRPRSLWMFEKGFVV